MARDLANGKVFPVSEAVILQYARRYGIGRKLGRSIIFSAEDCERLYEILPCPSDSFAAPNHPTSSCAAPSGEFALKKALELTKRKSQRKSEQNAKQNSSPSQFMVGQPRQ